MVKRNLWAMVGLMIITFGIYLLYWIYVTKKDLNRSGGDIPTFFLFFIPIANFYFLYKFAESFCTIILKSSSQTIGYFLLIVLLMPVGAVIYQAKINEVIMV